ncbi:NAD(P)H-hydrate dehydratase [Martelella alba]|uniref:Bifunctional NAD(P)H-hydrate repair enzyme n=1 Tax=Martelella alba TaxID=2590451 RepID=A0A506UI89_9HYPH|nr:NAD(P)H-hydrate dehydratase [Martelella alba]TPW33037.1 NAD(P)H-hydrate dehydratase [Martelella alba]
MQILTPAEMGMADRLAAEGGIDSFGLMVKAGHAVAAAALRHFPDLTRAVIFCGPGNNGGDGYVAANVLADAGVPVALFHFGDPARLKGDAAIARNSCNVESRDIVEFTPEPGDLVIDALFGAGLARPLDGAVAALIETVGASSTPVLAVDLPSGLCGRRGLVLGAAFQARRTVSFMAPKPGHYLLPGRTLCGVVEIADIGIPQRIINRAAGRFVLNGPEEWRSLLPRPEATSHKYSRGHLVVFSGPHHATGAARLAAHAGLKAGAGLVTLAVPSAAADVVAAHETAIMLRSIDEAEELAEWLKDGRLSAFVLGPGFGDAARARAFVRLLAGKPLVLDADGISAFAAERDHLFKRLKAEAVNTVLTPHEGEFRRMFPEIASETASGKMEKALAAANLSGAVILYKGADTVIASPDGRAAINANAPPFLATAGSGDVLAGLIGGLMAEGMPAFEAACAGAFLHGEAGNRAGPGLSAEDLCAHLPPPETL